MTRPTAGWAAILVAVLAVGPAVGQNQPSRPTLPSETLQVEGPFTPQQQQAVETYVNFFVQRLHAGEQQQINETRVQLTSPLTRGGTEQFERQYSAVVSQALTDADATAHEDVVVRLNTMIVVSKLAKDDRVVRLILTGTEDQNPAVRYWSVRAVRGNVGTLSSEQRQQLVTALSRMIDTEQVDEVLRQVLGAMIELDAVDAVVQALNELVKLHIGEAQLRYDAKREAMRSLLQKLQVMDAQQLAVEPQIRQTARAACRYMILITQQAQGASLEEMTANDHVEMVRLNDTVLRYAHQRLGSTVSQPSSIQGDLAGKNWQALQAAALQWRQILTQQPFNFTDVDLSPAGR